MKSALQARLEKLSTNGSDALVEMTNYVIEREGELSKARDQMFRDKLKRFENMAASIFTDRLAAPMGGTQARPETRTIFDHALSPNFSLQLVRSVIHFILARIDKDTFGSRPWLAVGARKTISQALAAEIQKHGEYKLMECLWRDKARGALQTAFDLGMCPVKTAWREDWNASEHEELILCGPDGEPIVAQNGDYIYPQDDTQEAAPMPMPGAQGMPPGPPPMAPLAAGAMPDDESQEPTGDPDAAAEGEQPTDDESAEPAGLPEAQEGEAPAAPMVFTKAPKVPVPDGENGLQWKSHLIEEVERLYAGLDVSTLNIFDVTYPINAGSMDLSDPGCDYIGLTSGMTVEQILSSWGKGREDDPEFQALIAELRNAGTGTPKSEAAKPNVAQREPEVRGNDIRNPTIKVVERYFRRRVMPTGPESRIVMVVAEELKKVIYVEYLTVVSPRGQAPAHMIAINRVPGRAYGRGLFELFELSANQLDKLFNGIIVRNEYHANPANFISKKAAADLASGETITHGPGTWNEVENKEGGPISALFYSHEMPAMDENTWKMVELIMQLIQTESGVTNASQGDMTDLPSNSTATGVNSMLESSSVLHTFTLEECRSCLTPPIRYALELTYFRQDGDDEYDVLDDASALQQLAQAEGVAAQGPPQGTGAALQLAQPASQPGVMTYAQAKALANVPLNVEILLTRAKNQELREAAQAALPLWQDFRALPPQEQLLGMPLIQQVLNGLGISNPDRLFPTPAQLMQQVQAAASQSQQSPEERISMREQMDYKDTPPSIQRQMEKEAGFTPASPEEAAAFTASQQKPAPGTAPAKGKKPSAKPPAPDAQPPAAAPAMPASVPAAPDAALAA